MPFVERERPDALRASPGEGAGATIHALGAGQAGTDATIDTLQRFGGEQAGDT